MKLRSKYARYTFASLAFTAFVAVTSDPALIAKIKASPDFGPGRDFWEDLAPPPEAVAEAERNAAKAATEAASVTAAKAGTNLAIDEASKSAETAGSVGETKGDGGGDKTEPPKVPDPAKNDGGKDKGEKGDKPKK